MLEVVREKYHLNTEFGLKKCLSNKGFGLENKNLQRTGLGPEKFCPAWTNYETPLCKGNAHLCLKMRVKRLIEKQSLV
jgi:hypothetical protein